MKKSISTLAMLAASSSAFGLMIDPDLKLSQEGTQDFIAPAGAPMPDAVTVCFSKWEDAQGNLNVSDCDETQTNQTWGLEIKEHGCAEGQIAMVTYQVIVPMCPTFVQL